MDQEFKRRVQACKRKVQEWVEQFPLGHLGDEGFKDSLRSFSNYNLRVTLVTYGTHETYGWNYLASVIAQERVDVGKIRQCTHRLDYIFDHSDHLSSRGRHWSAQAEFIDIFSRALGNDLFHRQFRKMIYKIYDSITENMFEGSVLHLLSCRHGHHRSQAFCELLRMVLVRYWPCLRVDVWHLDEQRWWRPDWALNESDFKTHFRDPLLNALSPPSSFRPLHRTYLRTIALQRQVALQKENESSVSGVRRYG